MPYRPIRTAEDLVARVASGVTREDSSLDFKDLDQAGRPSKDALECRRDVVQFANDRGGTILIGAVEIDHVFAHFVRVSTAQELIRWIDEAVKAQCEPVPVIDPIAIRTNGGEEIVALNIPPSIRLVAIRQKDAYEVPIRNFDSRRYMTLGEVEARMQDRDRVHRLRLEQIGPDDAIGLDATVDSHLGQDDWRIARVDDGVVVLTKSSLDVVVPLAYVQSVYEAGLQDVQMDHRLIMLPHEA